MQHVFPIVSICYLNSLTYVYFNNKYLKPDSVQDPHFAWFCLFPLTLLQPGHPKRIYTIALITSLPSMLAKNHLHIQCKLHLSHQSI